MPQPPAQRGLSWFLNDALPLWLDQGVDWERGGFAEALEHQQLSNTADFRRLRVTARQIYTFAAATRMDVGGARDAMLHGLDFLLGPARHPDWGFASKFDLQGHTIDDSRDLYDLAFVCFALAHAYDITQDSELYDEAKRLLQDLIVHLSHPAGGFEEAAPARFPRRQNPHMHLLEACLAWSAHAPGSIFEEQARNLLKLFEAQLFHAETGSLPEYFDKDWTPLRTSGMLTTEPGHHFEWVWLLHEAQRLQLLPDSYQASNALYAFATQHGLDTETGMLLGEVSEKGQLLSPSVRLWPATEWTKAEAIRISKSAKTPSEGVETAWSTVERFLHGAPRGLWHETWHPDHGFQPGPSPASSLYHIVMAIETMQDTAGAQHILSTQPLSEPSR